MSKKRKYEVDILATKGDIVKDIIADNISRQIHKESGIACSVRENTEIRVNIIRLEQLVREYDLNNPEKEIPFEDKIIQEEVNDKKIFGLNKFKTYEIIREDLEKQRKMKSEYMARYKRKKDSN